MPPETASERIWEIYAADSKVAKGKGHALRLIQEKMLTMIVKRAQNQMLCDQLEYRASSDK